MSRIAVLLSALLALAGCAGSALDTLSPGRYRRLVWQGSDVVDVPIRRIGHHLFVDVTINGAGPYAFLLDTGADVTFLDPEIELDEPISFRSSDLMIGGVGSERRATQYAEDVAIGLGRLQIGDVRVVVLDTAEIEEAIGARIDGFIGWDLLRHFVWELDLETPMLRIHARLPSTWATNGWTRLGVKRSLPLTVSVGDEQIDGQFAIDSGGEGFLVIYPRAGARLLPEARSLTTESRGIGGNVQFETLRARRISLPGGYLEDVPVRVARGETRLSKAAPDGFIGLDTLSFFRLRVDGPAGKAMLEPTGKRPGATPRALVGMALVATGSDFRTLRVQSITPDSPAEAAGFEPGDVVIEVDGRSTDAMYLPEVRDLLLQPGQHRVVVIRGSESVVLTLEPRVYD